MEFTKSVAKLTNVMENTGIKSAIKTIFRDEPEKVKAMNDVWMAYQTLGRTAQSPMGGGSDTFEHIMTTVMRGASAKIRSKDIYLVKIVTDNIAKYNKFKIDKYLTRAVFDPDYAYNLISIAKQIKQSKLSEASLKQLGRYIGASGIAIKEQPESLSPNMEGVEEVGGTTQPPLK